MIDDGTPVEMTLGVKSPVIQTKVATRAAGSVGSVATGSDDPQSRWSGQDLYILAYQAGETDSPKDPNYTEPYIDNLPYKATSDQDAKDNKVSIMLKEKQSDGVTDTEKPYFYFNKNKYEFYGYYIDDAAASYDSDTETFGAATVATVGEPVATKELVKIPFQINGGQDLMIGRTDKAADVVPNVAPSMLYSAYSSRRGAAPNLQFDHVLSRFTFNVIPGAKSAGYLQITNIKVKSYNKGFLNVAGTYTEDLTALTTEPMVAMDLKHKVTTDEAGKVPYAANQAGELVALGGTNNGINFKFNPNNVTLSTGQSFTQWWESNYNQTAGGSHDNKSIPVGESLMVIPGETMYEVILDFEYNETAKAAGIDGEVPSSTAYIMIKDVKLTGGASTTDDCFMPGKSYDITIVVYGPEGIAVTATLKDWVDGGDQTYDEDATVEKYLQFAKEEVTFGANADVDAAVKIFYNTTAAVSASAKAWGTNAYDQTCDWITLGTVGTSGSNLTLGLTENPDETERRAQVTITDGTLSDNIIIVQEGKAPAVTFTVPATVSMTALPATGSEMVEAWVDYTCPTGSTIEVVADPTEDGKWCEVETRPVYFSNNKFKLIAPANTGAERTSKVTVKCTAAGTTTEKEITVTQAAGTTVTPPTGTNTITPETDAVINIAGDAQTGTKKLVVNFATTEDAFSTDFAAVNTWVTSADVTGNDTDGYTLTVTTSAATNPGTAESGVITVTNGDASVDITVNWAENN